jgi:hypothetical protein
MGLPFPEPDCLQDVLVTVFENGTLTREYTFEEVRKNAELTIAEIKP